MSTPRRFLQNAATAASTAAALSPAPPMSRDSDVVVILAALLCGVICVVGLFLVVRCAWIRRNTAAPAPSASTTASVVVPPSPNKGIKKKVLRSLPTLSYQHAFTSEGDGARNMSSDCAICLAEFAQGDEIRVLPQCGHLFHAACVDVWLGSHSSCPSCRRVLMVTSGRCQKCGVGDPTPAVTIVVEEDERKNNGDGSGSGNFLP